MSIVGYDECPACGEEAQLEDDFVEIKITYQELVKRIAAEKIIKKIVPQQINYQIVFPLKTSNSTNTLTCLHCNYYEKTWG